MLRSFFCSIIILIIFSLSACGFTLRAQNVLPLNLHHLKLESATPYGDFESTLRQNLIRLGAYVTRTNCAPVTLHIISTELYQDVPTIGGSNQARVYVYYYRVTFEILDANHNILLPQKCVTTSETLIVNAGTALEATNQLEILKQEMRIEATHMIINILNSPQVSNIVQCN